MGITNPGANTVGDGADVKNNVTGGGGGTVAQIRQSASLDHFGTTVAPAWGTATLSGSTLLAIASHFSGTWTPPAGWGAAVATDSNG